MIGPHGLTTGQQNALHRALVARTLETARVEQARQQIRQRTAQKVASAAAKGVPVRVIAETFNLTPTRIRQMIRSTEQDTAA